VGSFILAELLKGSSVRSNPTRSAKLTSSALKAAGVVGAVAERFFVALTTAAEAERFFFGNNTAVRQRDFSPGALYFGGSIGNDYDF